jgi:peptidoglycan/LPS O-acetylase OafA/YrhL
MSTPRGPRWRVMAAVSTVLLALVAATARDVVPPTGVVAVALAAGILAALIAGTRPTPGRIVAAISVLVLVGPLAQNYFYGFGQWRNWAVPVQAPAIIFLCYFGALAALHAVRGRSRSGPASRAG